MKHKERPGYQKPNGYDDSKYKKPSVACDMAIFTWDKGLKLLLIKRRHDPYAGYWALPGGFVEIDESLEAAAARELVEETGVSGLELIPFGMFGDPERDPRSRVISAAYMALVPAGRISPKAGDDAQEAEWFPLIKPPELAFDHDLVLKTALARLRELTILRAEGLALLAEEFKLDDAAGLLKAIIGSRLSKRTIEAELVNLACIKKAKTEGCYSFVKGRVKEGELCFVAR